MPKALLLSLKDINPALNHSVQPGEEAWRWEKVQCLKNSPPIVNTFLTIHCHNCLARLYHVQCLYRPMKVSLFENWNRNFFRVRNRPNSWGNVRIHNLMLVFLPNTRCIYHAEITVSYMVVGFTPNHWNSKRRTIVFSFGPVSKHFLTIVAHNMRSPLLVLITKMNFKICLVGMLDEQGYVISLTIECLASTYVAEGIRLVSAMMSHFGSHVWTETKEELSKY